MAENIVQSKNAYLSPFVDDSPIRLCQAYDKTGNMILKMRPIAPEKKARADLYDRSGQRAI